MLEQIHFGDPRIVIQIVAMLVLALAYGYSAFAMNGRSAHFVGIPTADGRGRTNIVASPVAKAGIILAVVAYLAAAFIP
jgi:hypothetical protein